MNGSSMGAKIGPLALIGIVVVIAIVALGAYAWLTLSSLFHGAAPSLLRIAAANRTVSLSQAVQNMTQGLSGQEFEVSYSGNASVDVHGISLSVPLNLSLDRYHNDSRATVELYDVPLIGNLSLIQIRNGSSYYNCDIAVNNSKRGYQCSLQPESNSIFTVFSFASNSSQGFGNSTVHIGTVNQSSHNGIPCTNMDGYIVLNLSNAQQAQALNLSSKVGQRVSSANMTFASCVSSSDPIPLTLRTYMVARNGSSSISASLQLSETAFSMSSSPAIAELPGPVVAGQDGPMLP